MVKLTPEPEQYKALLKTLEAFNAACNYIAEVAFANKCSNKFKLQTLVYYAVRERFGLSAQMAVRAIGKVVDAYKRDKKIKVGFKPHGAMVFDDRIYSFKPRRHSRSASARPYTPSPPQPPFRVQRYVLLGS